MSTNLDLELEIHSEDPQLTLEYIENMKRIELESEMEEVFTDTNTKNTPQDNSNFNDLPF